MSPPEIWCQIIITNLLPTGIFFNANRQSFAKPFTVKRFILAFGSFESLIYFPNFSWWVASTLKRMMHMNSYWPIMDHVSNLLCMVAVIIVKVTVILLHLVNVDRFLLYSVATLFWYWKIRRILRSFEEIFGPVWGDHNNLPNQIWGVLRRYFRFSSLSLLFMTPWNPVQ